LVVLEATNTYWMSLAWHRHDAGYAVSVINPAQAHQFAKVLLKRAKTDAIDAHAAQRAPVPSSQRLCNRGRGRHRHRSTRSCASAYSNARIYCVRLSRSATDWRHCVTARR